MKWEYIQGMENVSNTHSTPSATPPVFSSVRIQHGDTLGSLADKMRAAGLDRAADFVEVASFIEAAPIFFQVEDDTLDQLDEAHTIEEARASGAAA